MCIALLFQQEDDGLAPPIGPRHLQWHIQLEEAVAESILRQFLPYRCDQDIRPEMRCHLGGKEGQCFARVVKDEVLEVLIVTGAHAVIRGGRDGGMILWTKRHFNRSDG